LNNQGTYDNSIDPAKRKVTQDNINDLGLGAKLATGSANIGSARNWLHDAEGNIASTWSALTANPYGSSTSGDNTKMVGEFMQDTKKELAPRDKTYVAPPVVIPVNR
jgi:hypothetical protein